MEGEEIEIKHKIECRLKEENHFRLFGDIFVENNKNNCKMFINGVENQLISNFEINSLSEGEGSTQISEANSALFEIIYFHSFFQLEYNHRPIYNHLGGNIWNVFLDL